MCSDERERERERERGEQSTKTPLDGFLAFAFL